MVLGKKSKIITTSIRIQDIHTDSYFFQLPDETKDPEFIKEKVLEKYHTGRGSLEAYVDKDRIILQWYPDDVSEKAEAYHQAAIQRVKQKAYDQAVEAWDRAISTSGGDAEYYFMAGLTLYEQKKYRESVKYLSEAVKICAIHYKAHLILGINFLKLRLLDKAEIHVLESYRLNRSNVLTYLNLGAIFSIQKRFNEAIDIFNKTIQLDAGESRAYLGLARIYSLLNDVEAANSHFRKVIELAPDTVLSEYAKRSIQNIRKPVTNVPKANKQIHKISRGIDFYLSSNYNTAVKQYKNYLKNNPTDDFTWYLLGESEMRRGGLAEARDCFKRSLRINPKRSLYYKSMGIVLHLLGRTTESIEILRKALEMGKNDPLTYTLYGVNLMRETKFSEARNAFEKAMEKNPNNPLAMYHLAMTHLKMNHKEKSLNLLNKITKYEFYAPIKEQAKHLINNIKSSV